jgi:hypothetical protein
MIVFLSTYSAVLFNWICERKGQLVSKQSNKLYKNTNIYRNYLTITIEIKLISVDVNLRAETTAVW